MNRAVVLAIVSVMFHGDPLGAQEPGRDRVFKVDVVELIDRQTEVEGRPGVQVQHGRYLYLFADAKNVGVFEANPTKYEIQLGGACARMGPLSGEGSAKIFAVHDNRLYLFASEQCRRGFLRDPAKVLETDDETPVKTPQSEKQGRALIDRAVDALGGVRQVDSLVSYQEEMTRETETQGISYRVTRTTTFLLPDGVANVVCWNQDCWSHVAIDDEGWKTSSAGVESMVDSERQALGRTAGRHPLPLLRNRNAADMTISSHGKRRQIQVPGEGAVDVTLVLMHRRGASTTLGVDAEGHVRWMSYRGRGPTMSLGTMEFLFGSFHNVEGLVLPGRVDVVFEGKPVPDESGVFSAQVVNHPSHRRMFQR